MFSKLNLTDLWLEWWSRRVIFLLAFLPDANYRTRIYTAGRTDVFSLIVLTAARPKANAAPSSTSKVLFDVAEYALRFRN